MRFVYKQTSSQSRLIITGNSFHLKNHKIELLKICFYAFSKLSVSSIANSIFSFIPSFDRYSGISTLLKHV